MNDLQKKFFGVTFSVFLATIGCALLIRTGGDLFLQPAFSHLFARYDLPTAILLIFILIAGFFVSKKIPEAWVNNSLDFIGNNPLTICFLSFCIMAFGAYFIYHHHPLSMDEYMPCFQARIFAEGKLWGQYPPELVPWLLRPGFFSVFSADTGRVVSDYWPGFALMLTPLMKLGVPWLLNPIISAGTLLLIFYYTKKIFPDAKAASWGVLLTLSSSVLLVNGISFYSMNAHLFLNLLYATLLLNISPLRLFFAGLVGSFALVMHNPVPHIAFALPWLVWVALNKNGFRNIIILFLGYFPLSLSIGLGWFLLKLLIVKGGDGKIVSHAVETANSIQADKLTIAYDQLVSTLFNKISSLINNVFKFPNADLIWFRLIGFLKLFSWSLPGLPILALYGIRHIKGAIHLKLWGFSTILTLIIYLFVPVSQGHGWGFRYFHSSWIVLPLFSIAFLTSNTLPKSNIWKKLIISLSILSLIFCTGLRYFQVHQFIGQHLAQLPVFEKGKSYVSILNTSQGYYVQDLIQNDPFLRDPAILFRSIDIQEDSEMIKSFFHDVTLIESSSEYDVWEITDSTDSNMNSRTD